MLTKQFGLTSGSQDVFGGGVREVVDLLGSWFVTLGPLGVDVRLRIAVNLRLLHIYYVLLVLRLGGGRHGFAIVLLDRQLGAVANDDVGREHILSSFSEQRVSLLRGVLQAKPVAFGGVANGVVVVSWHSLAGKDADAGLFVVIAHQRSIALATSQLGAVHDRRRTDFLLEGIRDAVPVHVVGSCLRRRWNTGGVREAPVVLSLVRKSIAVGVGGLRIRPERPLVAVRDAVAVGVGILGVCTPRQLVTVGHAVTVEVVIVRIGANLALVIVRETVPVCVPALVARPRPQHAVAHPRPSRCWNAERGCALTRLLRCGRKGVVPFG